MGALVSFFAGGPARIQALLIIAGFGLAAGLGLLTWGLYWRGEYREAKATVVALQAQGEVLAVAVAACSDGVDNAKKVGDEALRTGAALLVEARRLHADVPRVVGKLEDLMNRKPPARADGAPADCRDAWRAIAEEEQKAGRGR